MTVGNYVRRYSVRFCGPAVARQSTAQCAVRRVARGVQFVARGARRAVCGVRFAGWLAASARGSRSACT